LFTSKSSSENTVIPSFSNIYAVIPLPLILFPVNVPSYTKSDPHEGLPSFNIALVAPSSLAILRFHKLHLKIA